VSDAERLDVRLERGAVEIDEVIEIARMLAVHLDAEHAAGRVDGAVVPSRIELRPGGAPMLLPAAREHRSQKAYIAHEVWGIEPTPASDQFSMAAILYEALCGGRAFPGDDSEKIRVSIVTGNRVPLAARVPGLADAVDDVFTRALAVEPAERYPSCAAFADELVSAMERSRDAAAQVLVQKPSSRPPGSHRPPRMPSWDDEDPPIPWLKVAVGLVMLAAIAALLAVASK
jgi:eukaryotic-like serine/threonine-protein kinase